MNIENSIQSSIYVACFIFGIVTGYKLKRPLRTMKNIALKEPAKLALIVREDLKMGKGKIAAQCCHGSLLSYLKVSKVNPDVCEQWTLSGQPKIVLRANHLEEIFHLEKEADRLGIVNAAVYDAGHTQVVPGTLTVLAIGPDKVVNIDQITAHLKLL